MRFFIFIPLLCFSLTTVGQALSEADIQELAKQMDEQARGLDIGNGVSIRGIYSIGRTLFYQYDVPSYWEPSVNIKEEFIANCKTGDAAKTFFLAKINVTLYYWKGNALIENISVKSNEFSPFNYELGEYLSIKRHAKSKGVNLKLKIPEGWEVMEGDRPNIVKKFSKDGNVYIIQIRDYVTFFSRSETKEFLSDESFVNESVEEFSSHMKNFEVIDKSVLTIDTYPSVTFKARGEVERLGATIQMIMRCWAVYYEDKIVFLMSIGTDNDEFLALEQLYFRITNSVIFPDQYN